MSTIVRSISPFDAFAELRQMAELMDRAFASPTNGNGAMMASNASLAVPIEVLEKDGKVMIKAAVPGISPEELEVSVENNVLTIRGELKREHEEKDVKVYRREYSYGSFSRSIRLPDDLDLEKVDAEFKHGFVTISIPRVELPVPEVKRIAVRAS
ncbi:MAG: hypothetical protein AMXMBFR81_20930 [Chthonomonas sp.]